MYSTTETSSVSQGTVMDERPSRKGDDGREGENHDGVVEGDLGRRVDSGSPLESRSRRRPWQCRRRRQQDEAGDVWLSSCSAGSRGANRLRTNSQPGKAMEKGFTSQF